MKNTGKEIPEMNEIKNSASAELCVEGDTAVFYVSGELDHHSVKALREEIDGKLISLRPKKVIIDMNGVTFTDSAGLGLILGRYTRISDYGGVLSLRKVSEESMKILKLAGCDRLMKMEGKKA